jgi:hypothetical protein
MMPAIPQQRTGQLEQAEVLLGLFVIAHQNRAACAQPSVCPFHHLATCGICLVPRGVQLFLANASHVGDIAIVGYRRMARRMIPRPCPSTGAVAARRLAVVVLPQSRPRSHAAGWYHAGWLPPPSQPIVHRSPQSRGSVWCRFCPDPSGSCRSDPPNTSVAHGTIGGLPVPIDTAHLVAGFHEDGPDAVKDPLVDPALEGAMDRAVIRKRVRELVPLAPRAEPEDHGVQCGTAVNPLATGLLGWVKLGQDGLDHGPQRIGYPPDCR